MRIFGLGFLVCAVMCGSVGDAGAVFLEGVDVANDSLTAEHFPAFEKGLTAVQGSYLAYANAQRMKLGQERDEKFPGQSPEDKMEQAMESLLSANDSQGMVGGSDSWVNLLQERADWEVYNKKIQKLEEVHDFALNLPAKLVGIFLAVEKSPEAFELPAGNTIPKGFHEYDTSFPIKSTQHWELADSEEMKFFRKHADLYACVDIEDHATEKVDKVSSILAVFFEPALLEAGVCAEVCQKISQMRLQKRYNQDDYFNAWFVTTKLLFPALDALRAVQQGALAKREQQEAAAS